MKGSTSDAKLQKLFVAFLIEHHIPVSVYLTNGVKLQGMIEKSSEDGIFLVKDDQSQMIYKHAIATIHAERRLNIAKIDGKSEFYL